MGENKQIRTVLVGIDGSPGSVSALGWAIGEARIAGGRVEALYVLQIPGLAFSAPGYVPPTEDDLHRQGEEILKRSLDELPDHTGIEVTLGVASGIPVDLLLGRAGDPDVAVVALGSRGHSALARAVLGSVAHAMSHQCPKPLAIVPGGWPGTEVSGGRIVVGVDGSPDSERALAWAVAEAGPRKALVEAVDVWTRHAHLPAAHASATELAPTGEDNRLAEGFDAAVARAEAPDVEIRPSVLEGEPARVLIERSRDASLLVVGTRGRGWAREALLGSVSHACIGHAVVPTVIVPS